MKSEYNSILKIRQKPWKDKDSEVTFKKPTGQAAQIGADGYVKAASPRPYQRTNWGSTEAIDKDAGAVRSRANSVDLSASYSSFTSAGVNTGHNNA